jgi:hypothetical protein
MDRGSLKSVIFGCFYMGNGLLGMEVFDESDKKAEVIPQEEQVEETPGNKLLRAAAFGDKALIERLLAEGGDLNQVTLFVDPESGEIIRKGDPPLNYAVSLGNLEVVKIFLNNGADINRANDHGVTPLHVAMYSDNPNQFEIAELLLKKEANPNAKNNDSYTPLMIIVDRISELTERHYRFVIQQDSTFDPSSEIDRCSRIPELLVNYGTNIDIQDNQGNTALFRAISFQYPSLKLVKNLIQLGANVNIPNNDGKTPLARATANLERAKANHDQRGATIYNQIIQLLRQRGARKEIADKSEDEELIIEGEVGDESEDEKKAEESEVEDEAEDSKN